MIKSLTNILANVEWSDFEIPDVHTPRAQTPPSGIGEVPSGGNSARR